MDIWEANSISTAYTAHPCENLTQYMCEGDACGGTYSGDANRYSGECDPDGCDFNSYRVVCIDRADSRSDTHFLAKVDC